MKLRTLRPLLRISSFCQRLQKPVILGSTLLHVGNIWLMSCSELDYKSHYYGWWGKHDTLDIMDVVDDISHNYFIAKKYTHLPLEWIDEWIQTKCCKNWIGLTNKMYAYISAAWTLIHPWITCSTNTLQKNVHWHNYPEPKNRSTYSYSGKNGTTNPSMIS
jgi:hypothetical protein